MFFQRLTRLQDSWTKKTTTGPVQTVYLLGYEDFTDSILVITRGNFYFLSSSKKCQVLKQKLSGKAEGFALHFIEKRKEDSTNADNFSRLILNLKKSEVRNFGYLAKEKSENSYSNRFCKAWTKVMLKRLIRDQDPEGEEKPIGWNFLSVEQDDSNDEDYDEEESDYSEDSDEESEEDSDDDDDESDDSDLVSEDEESDYDSEEGLEDKGMVICIWEYNYQWRGSLYLTFSHGLALMLPIFIFID